MSFPSRQSGAITLAFCRRGIVYCCFVVEGERAVIACSTGIEVWPLWRHDWLLRIPIDTEELANCVAISEDAKLILSRYHDASVRRWDAHTGEAIRESMDNHMVRVKSVAVRGNLIVSGSSDSFLYRYNVITGEVIGNGLEGHKSTVSSVAICCYFGKALLLTSTLTSNSAVAEMR